MSNDWVTVAEFANTVAADLAKAELDLEDIECELTGTYENQAIPAIGVMGPIRLLVHEADLPRARQILEDREAAREGEDEPL
ncbi:DUF2007 domain-containing protein [bacterium]|nr:DUF2007 domain-containing protein [bacterium]